MSSLIARHALKDPEFSRGKSKAAPAIPEPLAAVWYDGTCKVLGRYLAGARLSGS